MQNKQQKSSLVRLGKKTEHLWIRPYRKSDLKTWNEFSSGGEGTSQTFEVIRGLQSALNSSGGLSHLGVFEKGSGKLLGMLIYHLVESEPLIKGTLSIWLPNVATKRRYGKELTNAALDIAFGPLSFIEVLVVTHTQNRISRFKARQKGGNRHGPGTRI